MTEKLIEMVRNNPILYNLSHADYKNTRKKDKIWNEIGKELNHSGEEVKKKWKNLRDTNAKYIRSTKKKSGHAGKRIKKWIWTEQMKFFQPYLTACDSVNGVSEDLFSEIDIDSGDNLKIKNIQSEYSENSSIANTKHQGMHSQVMNDIQSPASYATATTTVLTKQKTDRKRSLESSSPIGKVVKHFENETETEYDAIDYLLLSYAKTIKTFSGRRQAITKMRIAQVIMEQEIKHQEELTSTVPLSKPEKSNNKSKSFHSKSSSSSSDDESVQMLDA